MVASILLVVFGIIMFFATENGLLEFDSEELSVLRKAADRGDYQWVDNQIAWIRIYGTHIDYPVMQSGDNKWFLTHDFLGRESSSGAIFLDYRNRLDFSDSLSLVYGHRMNGVLMFSEVAKYEDSRFLDEHRIGELTTRGGQTFRLRAIEFRLVDADDELYRDLRLEGHSKKVLVLSTCDRATHKNRDVLIMAIE